MRDQPPINGCAFGRESRVMIETVADGIQEVKRMISEQGKQINLLFNHQSKKPSWLVALALTGLCTVCGSLIVYVVTLDRPTHQIHPGVAVEVDSAPVD